MTYQEMIQLLDICKGGDFVAFSITLTFLVAKLINGCKTPSS